MGPRVGGRYTLGRRLGAGSFGEVFACTDEHAGAELAIKLEPAGAKRPSLPREAEVYRLLDGGVGIPKCHWSGVDGDRNALVMDLQGRSLEKLFRECGRRLGLRTVLLLAGQMISRLEYVHSKGLLHRDVKPANFVLGLDGAQTLHSIDFGLARPFLVGGRHVPFREGLRFAGTARFASLGASCGLEPSRRDDMESIGYVLVYLLRGFLPWQGTRGITKTQRNAKISRVKRSTPLAALCAACPPELITYLKYCRNLAFEAKPDYDYLRGLFEGVFRRKGYSDDSLFDGEISSSFSPWAITSCLAWAVCSGAKM